MTKYFIKTYGCQMNHSDSERIASVLESAGYKKTSQESDADLIVINACSVRKSAVDRIAGNFKKYKKYKKKNPNLKTILTGCVLKTDKERFEKLFDLIIDIKEINKLFNCNSESLRQAQGDIIQNNNYSYFQIQPQHQSEFSAYVPVMTGCNNFCSYCVVPYTRGQEYSRPAKDILKEVKNLVNKGYKEIILLGQNVNSYKSGIKNQELGITKCDFPKLLQLINNISGDFWVRFLTSHPKDMTEDLIKIIAQCEKCTENIHLALQSGNNEILKKMNRKYTAQHFLELVKMIRKYIPNASITTDVIVGFPGETEKQFQDTAEIMKKVKFDMAYINKYSPRVGTESAKLDDDVSWEEKKKRENILNKILKETALENNQKYIGKIIDVLIEKVDKDFIYGKTESFKNVRVGVKNLAYRQAGYESKIKEGGFLKIKITQADAWGLVGEIIK